MRMSVSASRILICSTAYWPSCLSGAPVKTAPARAGIPVQWRTNRLQSAAPGHTSIVFIPRLTRLSWYFLPLPHFMPWQNLFIAPPAFIMIIAWVLVPSKSSCTSFGLALGCFRSGETPCSRGLGCVYGHEIFLYSAKSCFQFRSTVPAAAYRQQRHPGDGQELWAKPRAPTRLPGCSGTPLHMHGSSPRQ
ncbi:hypothetical protein BJX62DRAFT_50637 [Aspergillus germanicus]